MVAPDLPMLLPGLQLAGLWPAGMGARVGTGECVYSLFVRFLCKNVHKCRSFGFVLLESGAIWFAFADASALVTCAAKGVCIIVHDFLISWVCFAFMGWCPSRQM